MDYTLYYIENSIRLTINIQFSKPIILFILSIIKMIIILNKNYNYIIVFQHRVVYNTKLYLLF